MISFNDSCGLAYGYSSGNPTGISAVLLWLSGSLRSFLLSLLSLTERYKFPIPKIQPQRDVSMAYALVEHGMRTICLCIRRTYGFIQSRIRFKRLFFHRYYGPSSYSCCCISTMGRGICTTTPVELTLYMVNKSNCLKFPFVSRACTILRNHSQT